MSIDRLFFEILQIAIGNRVTLSAVPTKEQWTKFFVLSKKHALVAIAFNGVNRLKESFSSSDDFGLMGMDEITYLKWLGLTAKCAHRNKRMNEICTSLCNDLAHNGLYACILKGQSNLIYYPKELRDYRTPGDIDVWCGLMNPCGIDIAVENSDGKDTHYKKYKGERGVIEWVLADLRLKGHKPPEVQYHHIDWKYKGIKCEVHFKPSWMNNPLHNARLQKWCKENQQWNLCEFDSYIIPTVEFNVVYQLVHIYRHLFNEGIGLRQLLDYYFVLKALNDIVANKRYIDSTIRTKYKGIDIATKSKTELMHTLSYFGLKSFTSAVMWVLQEVFAMPVDFLLCKPDSIRGKFLLNEIMLAGNFGKHDKRNVIDENEGYLMRFVRRQKRFICFLTQYPSEVIWGPYFSIKQRAWRLLHGWR